MNKINSINELKEYIKNNYDYRIQKQEQYDDSPDYAYEDGVEDGENQILYKLGTMLGMDLEEMSEPKLCGNCDDEPVDICEECGMHYCKDCGIEGEHICNECKEEKENKSK